MRANNLIFVILFLSTFVSCTVPEVSKEGSKVQIVAHSNCKLVGNFQGFFKDFTGDLNYKNHHQDMLNMLANRARDKAAGMGANRLVEVYQTRDKALQWVMTFYSAHKCQ